MERRTTSWFSPNLQMEMPLVAYGHAGQTLLMLPTAAADYLEYERFYLVDAIKPFKVVRITGAVLGDRAIGAEQVATLASLPPRPVLQAKLAGAMQAPIATLAGLLGANLRSLGSIYYEPLWVFYRGAEIRDFGGLQGKRIAIGPEASGTRALALHV